MAISQDDEVASISDSLKTIYLSGKKNNLDALIEFLKKEPNPDTISKYAKIFQKLALAVNDEEKLFSAHLYLGNAKILKGELSEGLEQYFISMEYANKIDYEDGRGKLYVAIANAYSAGDNSQNAVTYYKKSIEILRKGNDLIGLASAIFNAGDEYFNMGKLDSAFLFTQRGSVYF